MAKKKPVTPPPVPAGPSNSPVVAVRLPLAIKTFLDGESERTGEKVAHLIIRAIEKAYKLPQSEIRNRGGQSGSSRKKTNDTSTED